jgi:osmotically-inducible protein OsmY
MKNLIVFLTVAAMPAFPASAQTRDADAAVNSAIRDSDAFRHALKNDEISVASRNGDVVLSGKVFEEYHLTLAQETALASPGVVSVRNDLTLARPDPVQDSNAWITARVKEAFVIHRAASAVDAVVEVENGVVYLDGETVGEAQKSAASAYAREVPGVLRVENRMTVAGTDAAVKSAVLDDMDDAATTLRVKTDLLLHRPRGAETGVKTKDGIVTLTGAASDRGAKERAGQAAAGVSGVEAVDNRMTVVGEETR